MSTTTIFPWRECVEVHFDARLEQFSRHHCALGAATILEERK